MSEITYRGAINRAMGEALEEDDRVFLIGQEMAKMGGVYAIAVGLLDKIGPERVLDTPICENGLVGFGVGAALAGKRPIVDVTFMDFTPMAMDAICNQAAKMRYMSGGNLAVPMVIRTANGSGTRRGAQHTQCLETWFMHTPGLKVFVPGTIGDGYRLFLDAVHDPDPVLFVEHKLLYPLKGDDAELAACAPAGKAAIRRSGSDLTLVTLGRMVQFSLQAAARAAEEGLDVELIDLRHLAPLDADTIVESVARTNRLLVVQEAPAVAGWGAEVAALVADRAFGELDAPIARVCTAHVPIPWAPQLEDHVVPGVERILEQIRRTAAF